jgi:hypothetical protein
MNYRQQNSMLMGASAFFIVAALILCGFTLQFTHSIRSARTALGQSAELDKLVFTRQMLFNELSEYAKRNPDLQRILQPGTPAPVKPAAK